jgi:Na+-translocating ferredoxin:NAD+ oxidoreductase RnfE subunit
MLGSIGELLGNGTLEVGLFKMRDCSADKVLSSLSAHIRYSTVELLLQL